jgi:hypothetical protein
MIKHCFSPIGKKAQSAVELEFNDSLTFDDVFGEVARHCGLDPSTVKFIRDGRRIVPTALLTSVTSSPDKPLLVFGKTSAGLRAASPSIAAPTPSVVVPAPPPKVDEVRSQAAPPATAPAHPTATPSARFPGGGLGGGGVPGECWIPGGGLGSGGGGFSFRGIEFGDGSFRDGGGRLVRSGRPSGGGGSGESGAAPPPIDANAVQQLTEMGYSETDARKALTLSRGTVEVAAELLVRGDLSEAALQQLADGSPDEPAPEPGDVSDVPPEILADLIPRLMADGEVVESIKAGHEVTIVVHSSQRAVKIAMGRDFLDQYLRRATETPTPGAGASGNRPPDFGGGQGAYGGGHSSSRDPDVQRLTLDLHNLTQAQQWEVAQLAEHIGDQMLALQYYLVCDKNLEAARLCAG